MPKRKSKKIKTLSENKYPVKRLIEIRDALEKRVLAARETQLRNQLRREELEGDLEELQQERISLTERLTEAKQGEALTREKERQIAAEFHRLSDERRHCEPGPLLRRSLTLGRELFELLLKDVAIEACARNTWFESAIRYSEQLKQRAAERNDLQTRVLDVQRNCEADLEQKRHVYDGSGDLKNRNESLDAQIAMLKEWHSSLEMQIASVRAALNQKRHPITDDRSADEHDPGGHMDETKPIPMEKTTSPEWITVPTTSPTPSPGKVFTDASILASPSRIEDLSVDVILDKPKVCEQCNGIDCDPVFGHRTTFKTPPNSRPCEPCPSISLDCLAIISSGTTVSSINASAAMTPPASASSSAEDIKDIKFIPDYADEIPVEADFKIESAVPVPPLKTSPSSKPQKPEKDPEIDEMARLLNVLPDEDSDEDDKKKDRPPSWELIEDKGEKSNKPNLDAEDVTKALVTPSSTIEKPVHSALTSGSNESAPMMTGSSTKLTDKAIGSESTKSVIKATESTISILEKPESAPKSSSSKDSVANASTGTISAADMTESSAKPSETTDSSAKASSNESTAESTKTAAKASESTESAASATSTDSNASFTTIKTTAASVSSVPSSTGTTETAESLKLTDMSDSDSEPEFSDDEYNDETSELPSVKEKPPFDDIISKLQHLEMPKYAKDTSPPITPIKKPPSKAPPKKSGLIEVWHEVLPQEVVPSPKTSTTTSEYESSGDENEKESETEESHDTDCPRRRR